MPFEIPDYDFWSLLFTALGAIVVWCRLGRTKLRVYALSPILEHFIPEGKTRIALEVLVFVSLGAFVGVSVVQPSTVVQSIVAGMGWTSLFAKS